MKKIEIIVDGVKYLQRLCSMATITYDKEETTVEAVSKAWNRRHNNGC